MKKIGLNPENIKILVCCHKKTDLPVDTTGILFPIHVGASISKLNLEMQRDDQLNGKSCDNISQKNGSYCELTAMYWAWKNMKKLYPNLEYIGLNHYRRYFDFNRTAWVNPVLKKQESEVVNYRLPLKKMLKLLEQDKTIVASRKTYEYPLAYDYGLSHSYDDLKIMAKIAYEKNPECADVLKYHLLRNNKLSHFNMFIMKWRDFDKYCTWLFGTLEDVEKYINIENYSSVQKRIFGYMAERLLNVFCQTNNLKTKYTPIVQFVNQKNLSCLYYLYRFVRSNISNLVIRTPVLDTAWQSMLRDAEKLIDEKIG